MNVRETEPDILAMYFLVIVKLIDKNGDLNSSSDVLITCTAGLSARS